MKWNTGDIWKVTINGMDEDEPFQYKYVVIDFSTKNAIRWEEGQNRICDPFYLRDSFEENESVSTFEEEKFRD